MLKRSVRLWVPWAMVVVLSVVLFFPIPAVAQVFVLTVGPDGAYSTIQDAINAMGNDSTGHIRIEQGRFYGPVIINSLHTNVDVVISGGWDSTFLDQTTDPSLTIIDGEGQHRPLYIAANGGTVRIRNLTLDNGFATTRGGGISVIPEGDGAVILEDVVIENSVAEGIGIRGGGLNALLDGQDSLEILDCDIRYNSADSSAGGGPYGGGAFIRALEQSSVRVEGTAFHENSVAGSVQVWGAGLDMELLGFAEAVIEHSRITFNRGPEMTMDEILGFNLSVTDGAIADIRALEIRGNQLSSGTPVAGKVYQALFWAHSSGVIRLGDSLVAGGDAGGLRLSAWETSVLHSTNLTIADHPEIGIQAYRDSGAALSLYNTIAFGNGTDLRETGAPIDRDFNLIGIDPLFEDPGCGFFWLGGPGSPAVDVGTAVPPAGLGETDVDGGSRVVGPVVDIGAYELQAEIFSDGFESCDTSQWSATVPTGARGPCRQPDLFSAGSVGWIGESIPRTGN